MLDSLLNAMIYDARHSQSHTSKRKLKNGLHVHNRAEQGTLILTLARDSVYPSENEWQTVLRAWPYKIWKDAEPTIHHGRMAVTARIPVGPTQPQLKLE